MIFFHGFIKLAGWNAGNSKESVSAWPSIRLMTPGGEPGVCRLTPECWQPLA